MVAGRGALLSPRGSVEPSGTFPRARPPGGQVGDTGSLQRRPATLQPSLSTDSGPGEKIVKNIENLRFWGNFSSQKLEFDSAGQPRLHSRLRVTDSMTRRRNYEA